VVAGCWNGRRGGRRLHGDDANDCMRGIKCFLDQALGALPGLPNYWLGEGIRSPRAKLIIIAAVILSP
jgi:hypothetical protein